MSPKTWAILFTAVFGAVTVALVPTGSGEADARLQSEASQSSGGVRVSPAKGRRNALFTLTAPARYPMKHGLDHYLISLDGPGGDGCEDRLRDRAGISWSPRYNRRHARVGVRAAWGPHAATSTSGPPPADPGLWCRGRFTVTVKFHDGSAKRDRAIGRFTFTVDGMADDELILMPRLTGRARHDAECVLWRSELRWRMATDRADFPIRFRPLPGCHRRVESDSRIMAQDPAPGTPVGPGHVARLTARRP